MKYSGTPDLVLVLIESDWNLKDEELKELTQLISVLIESDWNLKVSGRFRHSPFRNRINRIRLEFKVYRILHLESFFTVLIESDWNLK